MLEEFHSSPQLPSHLCADHVLDFCLFFFLPSYGSLGYLFVVKTYCIQSLTLLFISQNLQFGLLKTLARGKFSFNFKITLTNE